MRKSYFRKADTVFVFDPRVHMNLSKKELKNLDLLEEFDKFEWMKEVCNLSTGDSFGEINLFEDIQKDASIECLSNCYFAVLNKTDYKKVLKKFAEREL